ncbi:hypothetical protein EV421DRAFT_1733531 [Armillaria borealis]|uniref:AB hydrolase-1 domain-containing protein n=1 Tax=Armillaria borealis TaxID=47425 RepID=A0AA39JRN8_9AGAR|nr:hypothetical protein EV421DRAFT_1733531 [Armillaria borealis]
MKYLLAGFVLVLFGVYHLSGLLRVSHLCVSQSSKQVAKEPGEIIWEPCPGDRYAGLDCGSVVVPKDYFNPSAGTSTIAFARQNATQNRKGSVFLNPEYTSRGPGWFGNEFCNSSRRIYHRAALEAQLFAANTVIEQGITATVVRDMDFMSEVFDGEGAKINYWGGSYGSILGAYLVNMLPHRIGYSVIDGIADPINWSSEPSHKWPYNWLSSTEKTYRMYLEDCSRAGPALCPLAAYQDEPWTNLEQRLEQFFDRLALEPLATPSSSRPGYLTSGAARSLLLIHLERPGMWPASAKAFAEAMSGNGTQLYNWIIPPTGVSHENDVARLAVTCLDSPPPMSMKDFPLLRIWPRKD